MKQGNQEKQAAIIAWAMSQEGSAYVYGGTGAPCTPRYRRQRMAQYPDQAAHIKGNCPVLSGIQKDCSGCIYQGRACYDCAQFTRRALEPAGIELPSGASSQWAAGLWEHKGIMGPEAAAMLCLVFRSSGNLNKPMQHVGLSLGNGWVIDARNHAKGLVRAPITAYPWTHYAALPPFPRSAAIRLGDRGPQVRQLQTLLMARGFPLARYGADGSFGEETLQALHLAQASYQLPLSDEADEPLLCALTAPPQTQEQVAQEAGAVQPGLADRLDRLEQLVARLEQDLREAVA